MNKQVEIKQAEGIAVALAAAQMEMGKALKQSSNPHFNSKYADLGSVMDACLPALNQHGIAVIQPMGEDDSGRFVKTVLIHGATGESLECVVPLIVGKNDMQGYGSAVTYARRYGLMAMAGIAPEDDDGNAAAQAAPKKLTPGQVQQIKSKAQDAQVTESQICDDQRVRALSEITSDRFEGVLRKLDATIRANSNKNADLDGDEIPHQG